MHQVAFRVSLSIVIFLSTFIFIQTQVVVPAVAAVATCAQGGACTVGDIGPGGGKVFYASVATFACGQSRSDLCNYLEAAPKTWSGGSSDPSKFWQLGTQQTLNISGITDELIADNSVSALGLGYKNSIQIVNAGNGTSTAAGSARAYAGGSKNDWYLPNNAEMNVLCQWARGVAIDTTKVCAGGTNNPDFVNRDYWTSSEYNGSNAWRTWLSAGNETPGEKNLVDSNYAVRPIRAFTRNCAGGGTCVVGDKGPGGGIVFYATATPFACGPTLALTCKYLEGAVQMWNTYIPEPVMVWSTITTGSITAGGRAIGTGYKNTLAMIGQGVGTSPAGERVRAYRGVGPVPVSDWYMASIDELEAMWNSTGHLSFFANAYSSSSEEWDGNFSRYNIFYYSQGSGSGSKASFPKGSSSSPTTVVVKPIRAFSAIELTYTPRTISITSSSYNLTYAIDAVAPTLSASYEVGTGTNTFTSSTPLICSVGSENGEVTFLTAGICTISVSIAADSTYSAATNTASFLISKLSPDLNFSFSSQTANFRTPFTIALTSVVPGKVSLKVNGKWVSGCRSLAIVNSRSCTFKPSGHNQLQLEILFTPNDSARYQSGIMARMSIPVARRIGLR